MPANDRERDLKALRNLIDEAHLILSTVGTAKGGANAAAKLLDSALALADDLTRDAVQRRFAWSARRAEDGGTWAGLLQEDRGHAEDEGGRKT